MGRERASRTATTPYASVSPCKLCTWPLAHHEGRVGAKYCVRVVAEGMYLVKVGEMCFDIYREMKGPNHFPCWDLCHVLMVSGEGCESCSAGTSRTGHMPRASLATSRFLHLGHPWPVTQRPSGMHV